MKPNLERITVWMGLLVSVLTLFTAASGLFNPSIYEDIVVSGNIPQVLRWGSMAQDIFSLGVALLLAISTILFLVRGGNKLFLLIVGLLSYLFYAYALYSIQGMYSAHALLYLVLLGASLYAMVFGIVALKKMASMVPSLAKGARWSAIGFLALLLVSLVPIWLSQVALDIANRYPGNTYGVYVLDLGIVFPAIAIIIWLLARANPFGILLAGVALLKAFTVCASVALGEWFIPTFGKLGEMNGFLFALFGVLGLIALGITALFFRSLRFLSKKP
ncbi:MAG TPA: hypothetical protein PLF96_14050 [Thermotogota bacterium]|nr:hypothetical protein [Thermotogota bacterium]